MITKFFRIGWWKQFLASQKLALLLTGTTIVLAFWGFAIDRNVGDSVYNTIRLFNIDMDSPQGEIPWQIQAARFLAPIALAYAFLVALATVLRTQLQGFWVRHFYRGHVVIIGLGKQESLVARQLRDHDENFRIVGLEIDETSGAISGLRSSGVPVVIGDARDPEVLSQVRPEKASHIIVFTGDDSTNLEVLAALSGQLNENSDLTIHAVVDSPYLWTQLHRFQFDRGGGKGRVEFICLPDRTAGLLVDAAEVREGLQGAPPTRHIAVTGDGTVAARLIVELIRSTVFNKVEGFRVLVDTAEEFEEYRRILEETDPWVLRRPDVQINIIEQFDRDYSHPDTSLGFVVGRNEADTLAAVLRLREQIGPDARILAGVPDHAMTAAVRQIGLEFGRTEFVPVGQLVEGSHLVRGAAHELIARGRHKVHVRERIAAGVSPEEDPSLVSWDELPASLRKSNRDYADSLAAKLAALGAGLVPLEGNEPPALKIAPDVLEELAKEEHDRWCRDLVADGWKHTYGPKDPVNKRHPLLVPWDDLTEPERQKDRESILALPEIFASVGFGLTFN